MPTSKSRLLGLCLAGSALSALSLFSPSVAAAEQATRFTTADVVSAAPASRRVEFEVYLPLRNKAGLEALLTSQQEQGSASFHKWLTPAQFGAQFGPDAATMAAVARELAAAGFTVKQQARSVHVIGTAAMVRTAFGADLSLVHGAHGGVRPVALTKLKLSPTLAAAGARIMAFSPWKREMQTHSQVIAHPDVAIARSTGYWFDGLHQAYAYPASNATATAFDGSTQKLNGATATIATIIDSDVLDSDISAMFNHEQFKKFAGGPLPKLNRVYVDGATPGFLSSDGFYEASLDTQQEIGGAPGANVILYDIPDLSFGSIFDGYSVIDNEDTADVVSASFGLGELYFTPAYNGGADYTSYFDTFHELYMQGNAQGITFIVSSGDDAGRQCQSAAPQANGQFNYVPCISSPSNDPQATAVGGTNLQTAIKANSLSQRYKSENAYNDPLLPISSGGTILVTGGLWGAGGGQSIYFAQPSYESAVHTTTNMRTNPDVGMQVGGCPGGSKLPCDGGDTAINGNGNRERSFVFVYGVGQLVGLIGTSVAAPEFAGATALRVELYGRQGNLNPYLYQLAKAQMAGTSAAPSFHLGIPGYNGVHPNTFPAANYNYTTGLGTPFVATMMGVPAGTPLAGVPQTVTNP